MKQEGENRLFCLELNLPRTHGSHAETLHLLSLIQNLNITIQSEGVHEDITCFLPLDRPVERWVNRHNIVIEMEFKRALLYRLIGERQGTDCSDEEEEEEDDTRQQHSFWEKKFRQLPFLKKLVRVLDPCMQLLLFLKNMEWTVDLDDILEVC